MTTEQLATIEYTSSFFGSDITDFLNACNRMDKSFFQQLNCPIPSCQKDFELVSDRLLLAKADYHNQQRLNRLDRLYD